MDLLTAYSIIEGMEHDADLERYQEAARTLAQHPEVIGSAPGRVGRTVRDLLSMEQEEDASAE